MQSCRKRYNLTTLQVCRMAACWSHEKKTSSPFIADDIAAILDVERTMAGRFLREMESACMVQRVKGTTRHTHYRVTSDWVAIAMLMKVRGELPGLCQLCVKNDALQLKFAGAYLCRSCMMDVTRADLEMRLSAAVAGGQIFLQE